MGTSGQANSAVDAPLVTRVAELVGTSRSLPRVLDRIVTTMAEHGYPGAGITLINERDELYVAAYEGPPDEAILALRLPVGQGIMGRVAAEGRPLLVPDLDAPSSPIPANRRVGAHSAMRSLLAVPIVVDHSVVGVLQADSTQIGRFGEVDLALFEQVAMEIGAAVREVAPLELAGALLRRRVHEVMILAEVTRALASNVDAGSVAETVARYAALGVSSPGVVVLRLADQGAVMLYYRRTGEPVTRS